MNELIDVANWLRDEEFSESYPEGARDKTLFYCPIPSLYPFLKPGHRYLFKRSSRRYKEEFWVEIIAYQLGTKMNVPVPSAFAAYNSGKEQSGALIEWFLHKNETHALGGDFCQQYIDSFDRKKGKQHNFETIMQIFNDLSKEGFNDDWKSYWSKTFIFDALIGNTDRHQDNWGIIVNSIDGKMRITPVFNNGTSMGHEIFPNKFTLYGNPNLLEKYVSKGWHHMKWKQNDTSSLKHLELIKKLVAKYPETKNIMIVLVKNLNLFIYLERITLLKRKHMVLNLILLFRI